MSPPRDCERRTGTDENPAQSARSANKEFLLRTAGNAAFLGCLLLPTGFQTLALIALLMGCATLTPISKEELGRPLETSELRSLVEWSVLVMLCIMAVILAAYAILTLLPAEYQAAVEVLLLPVLGGSLFASLQYQAFRRWLARRVRSEASQVC